MSKTQPVATTEEPTMTSTNTKTTLTPAQTYALRQLYQAHVKGSYAFADAVGEMHTRTRGCLRDKGILTFRVDGYALTFEGQRRGFEMWAVDEAARPSNPVTYFADQTDDSRYHTRMNGTNHSLCDATYMIHADTALVPKLPDSGHCCTACVDAYTLYYVAPRGPQNTDTPQVHEFGSTGEAYDASQVREDIVDGDVLSVPSAGVVAVLVAAWPTAVDITGDDQRASGFHTLKEGEEWSDSEYGDYTISVALAREVLADLERKHAAITDACVRVETPCDAVYPLATRTDGTPFICDLDLNHGNTGHEAPEGDGKSRVTWDDMTDVQAAADTVRSITAEMRQAPKLIPGEAHPAFETVTGDSVMNNTPEFGSSLSDARQAQLALGSIREMLRQLEACAPGDLAPAHALLTKADSVLGQAFDQIVTGDANANTQRTLDDVARDYPGSITFTEDANVPTPAPVVHRGITAYRITDKDARMLAVGDTFTEPGGNVARLLGLARGPEYNGTSNVSAEWITHTNPAWVGGQNDYYHHALGLTVERVFENLTKGQREGFECVWCGKVFRAGSPSAPMGRSAETGNQVFGCSVAFSGATWRSCAGEDAR